MALYAELIFCLMIGLADGQVPGIRDLAIGDVP
jgi:hypothetical protein